MKVKVEIPFLPHWGKAPLSFEVEAEPKYLLRAALVAAVAASADLRWANLYGANLYGANLRGADLRGADLREADLRWADLRGANLYGANLCGADLRGADLRGADLRGANLCGADLRGADLRGADLYGANLYGANLYGANLRGADLRGADLRDVKNGEAAIAPTVIVAEGDLIVYKKCRDDVIVKLLIPKEAARSNANGRKCRAQFAEVLEFSNGAKEATSLWDMDFTYKLGERVQARNWETDRWVECGGGIHFFLTRAEAEAFNM